MNLRYLLHTRSWKHRSLRKSNTTIVINIVTRKYFNCIFVFRKQPTFTHRCCQFHIFKFLHTTPAAFSDDINPIYTYTFIWKLNLVFNCFMFAVTINESRFFSRNTSFLYLRHYKTIFFYSALFLKKIKKVSKVGEIDL